MKRSLLFIVVFCSPAFFAQTQLFNSPSGGTTDGQQEVIHLNPAISSFEFMPGVVLVKFRDDTAIRLGKSQGMVTTGHPSADLILSVFSVTAAEKLFPDEEKLLQKSFIQTFTGQEIEIPSLHNIYKLSLSDAQANIYELIEALNQDENVEFAEPNYLLSIVESEPVSPVLPESEMVSWLKEHPEITLREPASPEIVTPNDPLYSQQWGIPATQVNAVWDSTKGDSAQIIAILDTGVDWLHPDLKNKIWINPNEIPDNGIDDDNNGYIDDIRGWDWINNDNNPTDDNSHGTHVAGIAAAESNNGIGIAGVNWRAKIMPLKVFQSSGRGDMATIAKSVVYAKDKGASVINMSFGSYARSMTLENALANAYATSLLVAAAGNDGLCIGPGRCEDGRTGKPFYPGAVSFVYGVEAPPSPPTGFTNFDQDGPVFSIYNDLFNYEVKGPGVNIISTVPNGGYRIFNGTSMATPLVAGAVSLYRSKYPLQSNEMILGNLINTQGTQIQLKKAMESQGSAKLWMIDYHIIDTIDGDRDGRVDAGETIELWMTVRNTWNQADSVWCGIRFNEFEDTSSAEILTSRSFIGSLSAYAKKTNEFNPLIIKISPDLFHNKDIVFETLLWHSGSADTVINTVIFTVENGSELAGIFSDTLRLTANKNWLISGSFKITPTGVLILEPGASLTINSKLFNDGTIIANGTKDSVVKISGTAIVTEDNGQLTGNVILNYTDLSMYGNTLMLGQRIKLNRCTIDFTSGAWPIRNNELDVTDSRIVNWVSVYGIYGNFSNFTRTSIDNIYVEQFGFIGAGPFSLRYCNINRANGLNGIFYARGSLSNSWKNNFLGSYRDIVYHSPGGYYDNIPNQYWGTTDTAKIESKIYDFMDDASYSRAVYKPFLTQPSDSASVVVWKILVDGKDAQDERTDPLGVGLHRFDVYFSQVMDTAFTPRLSFGVTSPYSQHGVTENSYWSQDRKIWTAFHTVKLYTGDGINRLRVEGARDVQDFVIPIEDQRFEFIVDAAGSASADFQATAGLGKVNLEWSTPPGVTDLLGYNIYRFGHLTDTTFTDPILINSSLIIDTLYTDYEVIPNNKYYYYYKVVRTDFSESDSSRIVSSIPLTASHGDANGDLMVNVLDITTMVSYLLNQNPQPFIFEAADVNQDNLVNVLDIVGTVNIIMGGVNKDHLVGTPVLALEGRGAWLSGGTPVAGMQFILTGKDLKDAHVVPGPLAEGMELGWSVTGDTLRVVIYNFNRKTISSDEKGLLFHISKGELKNLESVIASNSLGEQIEVKFSNDGFVVPEDFVLYQNYPNPFNPVTVIKYGIPEVADVEAEIFNVLGEKVWEYRVTAQKAGYYELRWNSVNLNRQPVSSGVYILRIKAGKFISHKKMMLLR